MLIGLTSSHFTVWTHGTKCLILAQRGAERGSCPSPELAVLFVHTIERWFLWGSRPSVLSAALLSTVVLANTG